MTSDSPTRRNKLDDYVAGDDEKIFVRPNGEAFFTPDLVGTVYFDTLDEAKAQTGLTKVVRVSGGK